MRHVHCASRFSYSFCNASALKVRNNREKPRSAGKRENASGNGPKARVRSRAFSRVLTRSHAFSLKIGVVARRSDLRIGTDRGVWLLPPMHTHLLHKRHHDPIFFFSLLYLLPIVFAIRLLYHYKKGAAPLY